MYMLNGWWFLSSSGAYPPVFTVGSLFKKVVDIPLLTPLIDPNWINSKLAIALVKFF